MIRSAWLVLLVLLAFPIQRTVAQAKRSEAPTNVNHLVPVEWLVGGTWVSDVTDPSDGTKTHVENRLRWSPNHQAIEFNTDFNGKPHYNGFYAWNPASKSIAFYYTSSEGELTNGTANFDPDSNSLRQEFDIMHADGRTGHLRSTLVRDGKDAYWFSVFMQKSGEWAQVFRIRYERKGE